MTNRLDICSTCGSKLVFKIQDSVQGLFCPHCGWQVVTTYVPPIQKDQTTYRVHVNGVSNPSINQIRLISKICRSHYLETKKNLAQPSPMIYEGMAESVLDIAKELSANQIAFKIVPVFPYLNGLDS